MPIKKVEPWLCDGCPGKGNLKVDLEVAGSCPYSTIDSFRQARSWWLEHPDDYGSIEEVALATASGLRYYDEEDSDMIELPGDYDSALLGALCAQQLLVGACQKSFDQMLRESDI